MIFVFFSQHIWGREIKRMLKVSPIRLFSSKGKRNLVSLCQMLYVHAHYFNKAHFASCDCCVKRIVDDLGSVVKLMLCVQKNNRCCYGYVWGYRGTPRLSCYQALDESAALWNMLELVITQDKQESSVKFSTNGIIDWQSLSLHSCFIYCCTCMFSV